MSKAQIIEILKYYKEKGYSDQDIKDLLYYKSDEDIAQLIIVADSFNSQISDDIKRISKQISNEKYEDLQKAVEKEKIDEKKIMDEIIKEEKKKIDYVEPKKPTVKKYYSFDDLSNDQILLSDYLYWKQYYLEHGGWDGDFTEHDYLYKINNRIFDDPHDKFPDNYNEIVEERRKKREEEYYKNLQKEKDNFPYEYIIIGSAILFILILLLKSKNER